MKNTIKILCTDIDGTLLNEERWLSNRTITAFSKIQLPTILASSRPPQAMRYLQEGLGISGSALIAFNGGLILGENGKLIESNKLSTKILETLKKHHSNHNYNLSIYSFEHWFTAREDQHTKHEIFTTRDSPKIQSVAQTLDFLVSKELGIHKLMCMGTPDELDSIVQFLSPIHGNEVHLYRSKDTYLEITPKYIDKAKALKKLLDTDFDHGIDTVIAFGDNHNDDELLRNARYGVAVANATDNLKSMADYVSPYTNKEDAVARTMEKMLL
ncbi:Cof-type HAD-IIB family hydrolase [Spongiivirga citrea]|uniref:Cof-type HAD-IIB family hydrolase n=1 Tax=Spongiivirga citrea TaxID=1481457 RepID=A0A6M0CHL1_9FLAO|nr:Cof-type HAD-IIB family hydrolase [Spongiivirga citrea]NER17002.1 Cof-type HAD-IIB family hydrolase [Spongiivirga citrea]